MTDNERDFIIELEKLTRKYKIAVDGCGCCGSPFLTSLEDDRLHVEAGYSNDGGDIKWIDHSWEYFWRELSGKIVKG